MQTNITRIEYDFSEQGYDAKDGYEMHRVIDGEGVRVEVTKAGAIVFEGPLRGWRIFYKEETK